MTADLHPLQVLLVTLAGWVNRHQQHVIEYLIHRESDGSVHGRRCEDTGRPVSGSARGCRPRIRMVLSDPDKVLAKDRGPVAPRMGAERGNGLAG
jgi:hypothetical protein